MYTHRNFLFWKFLCFWIKFDGVESINLIPIDKQNLLDFCPICMKSLGTKSTREHKLHDLTCHNRTEKEMYDELIRGGGLLYYCIFIIIGYLLLIFFIMTYGGMLWNLISYELNKSLYSVQMADFVSNCHVLQKNYNDRLVNGSTIELLTEIKEGMNICFKNFSVNIAPDDILIERYHNMTKD